MPKVYPTKISVFLIADAIRNEVGGKTTIMGAFAGGQVIFPTGAQFPAAIPLAVFAVFNDGEGTFTARLLISHEADKTIAGDVSWGDVAKMPDQPMQMMANFNLFVFPALGEYKAEILLDDHSYTEHISIRIGDQPVNPT